MKRIRRRSRVLRRSMDRIASMYSTVRVQVFHGYTYRSELGSEVADSYAEDHAVVG